jgi:predicted ATPase
VLVGRNSSGKSTFLRAFPLLRQSVETARNSPVLWYHERYVDFGTLKDASNDQLSEPSVTFQFRLRLPKGAYVAIEDPPFDITMTLAGGEIPYVSAYEIRAEGHEVRWTFDEQGRAQSLIVNAEDIDFPGALSLGGKAHLLPTLQSSETGGVSYQGVPETFRLDPIAYHTDADDVLMLPLIEELKPFFHGNTLFETIRNVADEVHLGKRSVMLERLRSLSSHQKFQQSVSALNSEDDQFEDIANAAVARQSPYILEAADLVLAHFMSRVAYLAPLRVSAKRAYRIQNLAVDEVDPDGENLAMFLRSLSAEEKTSFAAFTRGALGFETAVRTTGIHAEILVKSRNAKRFVNLIDTGFGYSEVLPLAAILWASCIRPTMIKREPAPLVAIEQPELHLHPAHQAELAKMLVEAVTKSGGAKLLVETHSESLINGLGRLIYEGTIKADDVQIVLFDQDEETGQTVVKLAGYRENGALHDWPYGFLSPVAGRRATSAAAE